MKTQDQIMKALRIRIRNLSEERDKLQKIQDEVGHYEAAADEAVEALEEAVEILSKVV